MLSDTRGDTPGDMPSDLHPVIPDLNGVVLVTRGGRAPVRRAAGFADIAAGTPCTPQTVFQVASVGKQFLAAAVMTVVESGDLALHRPISAWIANCPPAWTGITLHHLLSNSSGLRHWSDLPWFDRRDPGTLDEFLPRLAAEPLLAAPGTRFRYSTIGFHVASLVLEEAVGERYGDFVARRIFEPLGLSASHSGPKDPPVADALVARAHRDGAVIEVAELFRNMPGTGDLWTTADDLARYAQAFDAGEILSASSRRLMCTPHVSVAQPPSVAGVSVHGYGYGYYVGESHGRPVRFHDGDNPGYRAMVLRLPQDDATVVVLSNVDETDTAAAAATLVAGSARVPG